VLHFTLPFKTPFKTRQLALEVFDPSFFVDFRCRSRTRSVWSARRRPAACDPAAE